MILITLDHYLKIIRQFYCPFYFCDKTLDKLTWVEIFYFTLQSIMGGSWGRNPKQDHGGRNLSHSHGDYERVFLTDLLPVPCSACFLKNKTQHHLPRDDTAQCLSSTPTSINHQLRNCPTGLPPSQSDGGIFSTHVSSSQRTLALVKLITANQYNHHLSLEKKTTQFIEVILS